MAEIVLDVFPACVNCGWSGWPRYRWMSDSFEVRPKGTNQFYVGETRCSNCDAHYRMYRPVDSPNWAHGKRLDA